MDTLEFAAAIIASTLQLIAACAWPCASVFLLILVSAIFHTPLSHLLKGLEPERLKGLGFDVYFREKLENARETARQAGIVETATADDEKKQILLEETTGAADPEEPPALEPTERDLIPPKSYRNLYATIGVLGPSAAILEAWNLLEAELNLSASRVDLEPIHLASAWSIADTLRIRGYISAEVTNIIFELGGLREVATHAINRDTISEVTAAEFIDLVTSVSLVLNKIPE